MKTQYTIRAMKPDDLPSLKAVIDATDLFPSDMLDEMIADTDSEDIWLTVDVAGPVAIAYCAPERMTEGTWNLYLIAVHPDHQGRGIGKAVVSHIEQRLAADGVRILLVETSGDDDFSRTRAFYLKCDYEEEARIRDYYQAGEDKVIFRKDLKLH